MLSINYKNIVFTFLLLTIPLQLFYSQAETASWMGYKAHYNGTYTGDSNSLLPNFSYSGYSFSEEEIPDVSSILSATATTDTITIGGKFWKKFTVVNNPGFDDDAIQTAIDDAEAFTDLDSINYAIVYFPVGFYTISSNSNMNNRVLIDGSRIILKGDGSASATNGGTEIKIEEPKDNINGWMFEFSGGSNTSGSTLIGSVQKNDFKVTVENSSKFSVGDYVQISNTSTSRPDLETYHYELQNLQSTPMVQIWNNASAALSSIHRIVKIQENTITFKNPILIDLPDNPTNYTIKPFEPLTNIGIEDIRFTGSTDELEGGFVHHKNGTGSPEALRHDYGWNAVMLKRVANSWIKNCVFSNLAQCVGMDTSIATTADNIVITGEKGHTSYSIRRCYGVLVKNSKDEAGMHHGPSFAASSSATVYLRYEMLPDNLIDAHAYMPFANLLDNVDGGILSNNGGSNQSHPNHGRDLVFWNFTYKSSTDNDSYNFWNTQQRVNNTFKDPWFLGFKSDRPYSFLSGTYITDNPGNTIVEKVYPTSLFEAQLELRKPNVPQNLVAKKHEFSVQLKWNHQNNKENSFLIERSIDGGTSWTQVGERPTNENTYYDTTDFSQGTAQYRVRSSSYGYTSDYSNIATVSATDSIPTGEQLIIASDDAYVKGGTSGSEFINDDNDIYIKYSDNTASSVNREGLFKFVVPNTPMAYAKLRLTVRFDDLNDLNVTQVLGDWTTEYTSWSSINDINLGEELGVKSKTNTNVKTLVWSIPQQLIAEAQNNNNGILNFKVKGGIHNNSNRIYHKDRTVDDKLKPTIIYSTEAPNAPTNLTLDSDNVSIVLSWDDNADNEDNYIIERKSNTETNWSLLDTVFGNTTTYMDTSIPKNEETYIYRVKAITGTISSLPSNEASILFGNLSSSIIAIEDSYVRGGTGAGDNYNMSGSNESDLIVKDGVGSAGATRETFLKFDLSTLPTNVAQAKLKLTVKDNDVNDFEAFLISDDSWSEGNITWNNRPLEVGTSLGIVSKTSSGKESIEWDITNEVLTELATDNTISIKILGVTDNVYSNIASKGSTTIESDKPTITYLEFPSFVAIEDSYVRGGSGAPINYNMSGSNESDLVVKDGTGGDGTIRETFLKFDLSTLPTSDAGYIGLKLTVTDNDINDFGAFLISDDSWSEGNITWNNRPLEAGTSLGIVSKTSSGKESIEWNITNEVLTELATDNTISIKILGVTDDIQNNIASKAFNTAYSEKPKLVYREFSSLVAVEDSYVRGGSGAPINYNMSGSNESDLIVKDGVGSAGATRETFLKFDLSTLPSNITQAKLKLTITDNDVNDFEAFLISDDSWSEGNITWNNRPLEVGTSLGIVSKTSSGKESIEWDITNEVLTELATDNTISIKILGVTDNVYSNIASKGSTTIESEKPTILYILSDGSTQAKEANSKQTLSLDETPEAPKSKLILYPNPVTNKLYLKNIDNGTYLNLFSLQGRLIRKVSYKGSIDVLTLANGTYLIKVESGQNKGKYSMFIKQ